MHIKRFEAPELADALRQVKDELGPHALILSSRRVRRDGGVFGRFGRPVAQVVAAVDRDHRRGATEDKRVPPDPSWRGLAIARTLAEPIEAEIRALRRDVESLQGGHDEVAPLTAELRNLRAAVSRLADTSGDARPHNPPNGVTSMLRELGLSGELASEVGAEAERRLLDGPGTGAEQAKRLLTERLDARLEPPHEHSPARVALMIGAAGVGKTTSLAKLAARRAGATRRVAVLSADTLRLGGHSALEGFADELGVPFRAAAGPKDLKREVSRLSRCNILVDTAGRSPRDGAALCELKRIRGALGRRARVHLVLSATTKEADLRLQLARYALLEPDSLIVTRLDESEEISNVFNVLMEPGTPPLEWIGTGQRVPEDLVVPEPDALASRLLGGVA